MSKHPRIGIGVFVRERDCILLGLRHGAHGSDTWSLPGGHLEFGESFEECAHREVMEECGITIENLRTATVTNDLFSIEGKHYVTIFIVCDYHGGSVQLREPDRCHEWRWCTWDSLPSPLFLPLQHVVEQGFYPMNIHASPDSTRWPDKSEPCRPALAQPGSPGISQDKP